jgi:hypothetical protein
MISISKLNSDLASFRRSLEGDEFRVCYDTANRVPDRVNID